METREREGERGRRCRERERVRGGGSLLWI